jgi:hypothetical protein
MRSAREPSLAGGIDDATAMQLVGVQADISVAYTMVRYKSDEREGGTKGFTTLTHSVTVLLHIHGVSC